MIQEKVKRKVLGITLSFLTLGLLTGCGASASGTVADFAPASEVDNAMISASVDISDAEAAAEEAKKKQEEEAAAAEEEATTEEATENEAEEIEEAVAEAEDESVELNSGINATELKVDESKLESDNEKVGVYILSGLSGGEVKEEDIELMNSMGVSSYLVLYNDNTGFINMYGEVTDLTWDESTMTAEGDTTTYTYADKKIDLTAGDAVMTFSWYDSY